MAKKLVDIKSIVVECVSTAMEAQQAIAREHGGSKEWHYADMERATFEFEGRKFTPLDVLAASITEAGGEVPEFSVDWFKGMGFAAFAGKWGKLVVGMPGGKVRANAPSLSQLRK